MMWVAIAGGIIGVSLLLAALFTVLGRNSQSQVQGGFKLLQDSFESMQRNLMHQQQEFERSYEVKSSALRTELSAALQNSRTEISTELQNNRKELQSGIQQLSQGVQTRLDQNVKEGFKHFEKVQEHLARAEQQLVGLNTVGQSINDLNNLLKLPHLRGNFGEATLERLLSDLLPADSFEIQYQISPHSTERVDAVIKFPKFVLPIDSKFPREQVLHLFEAADPAQLEVARKSLVDVMRQLGKSIKDKYIHPEHGTAEMALLFVPSETLYFEVIRNAKLCDDLAKNKVFPVSPNTLAVSLHAISIAREYYDMARGVEKTILEVKKAGQHFSHFEKKFDDVGSALAKAQTSFNTAQTHLSRYESAVTRLTGGETSESRDGLESALPGMGSLPLPERSI